MITDQLPVFLPCSTSQAACPEMFLLAFHDVTELLRDTLLGDSPDVEYAGRLEGTWADWHVANFALTHFPCWVQPVLGIVPPTQRTSDTHNA